jgi:uncharacterized membrane protein SpoIIM required for sporulation
VPIGWRNLIPKGSGEHTQARDLASEPELRFEACRRAAGARWSPRLASVDSTDLTSILDILKIIVGRRWLLIAILFLVEIAMIVFIANSAFLPSELGIYERQYNSTSAVLNQSAAGQVMGIFSNNFRVAIVELVPLLGLAIFGLSLYETARIVEVIAIVKNVGVGLALGNLFFLPSTWLELPAYAIAAAESFYLVYALFLGFKSGWSKFAREIRFLVVNIILIAGVLIVAAAFEVTEIQFEQGPVQTQAYALLTWIPFVVVFAGVIAFWRRARREAPALEERDAAEMSPSAQESWVVGGQGQPQPKGEKDADGSPTSEIDGSGATA